MRPARLIFTAICCLALVLPMSAAQGADSVSGLFSPEGETVFFDAGSTVIRQQEVTVHPDLVFDNGKPLKTVRLNFFDDADILAVLDSVSPGIAGGMIWSGHPESGYGQVTIAVDNGRVSATAALDFGLFQVRNTDDGQTHFVRELFPYDHPYYQPQKSVSSEEYRVWQLTNVERNAENLWSLSWNDTLAEAARLHSQDMADNNYFDHTGLDGSQPADRVTAAGYVWNSVGENIAAGYQTPEEVMEGWMNSPGHKANILRDSFCDLGVGYYYSGSAYYKTYWTQNFGRQQGVSTCPAAYDPGDPSGGGTTTQLSVSIAANPTTGTAPLDVSFTPSVSGGTSPYTYYWLFGDGYASNSASPTYTYNTTGTYTAQVTVTDSAGATATASATITVNQASSGGDDPFNHFTLTAYPSFGSVYLQWESVYQATSYVLFYALATTDGGIQESTLAWVFPGLDTSYTMPTQSGVATYFCVAAVYANGNFILSNLALATAR